MNSDKIILVVEDEAMLLQNIVSILDLNGFKTIQASSGSEGIIQAQTHHPDINISDVMMDNMNGIEFLSEIQANELTKNIPFIFLTARADVFEKNAGLEAGAVAYITKPFNGKELVNTINKFI